MASGASIVGGHVERMKSVFEPATGENGDLAGRTISKREASKSSETYVDVDAFLGSMEQEDNLSPEAAAKRDEAQKAAIIREQAKELEEKSYAVIANKLAPDANPTKFELPTTTTSASTSSTSSSSSSSARSAHSVFSSTTPSSSFSIEDHEDHNDYEEDIHGDQHQFRRAMGAESSDQEDAEIFHILFPEFSPPENAPEKEPSKPASSQSSPKSKSLPPPPETLASAEKEPKPASPQSSPKSKSPPPPPETSAKTPPPAGQKEPAKTPASGQRPEPALLITDEQAPATKIMRVNEDRSRTTERVKIGLKGYILHHKFLMIITLITLAAVIWTAIGTGANHKLALRIRADVSMYRPLLITTTAILLSLLLVHAYCYKQEKGHIRA